MTINKKGFFHQKNIIDKKSIKDLKIKMISIMSNYITTQKSKSLDDKLDKAFNTISKKSPKLRSNIFKAFGQLYDVPQFLYQKKIKRLLKKFGFKDTIIIGYGILAMEPKEKRFLFNIHQDLRTVFASYSATNIWIPLNNGNNIGGMGIYEESHKLGPIKHKISRVNGHEEVDLKYTKKFKKVEFKKLEEGDCYMFSPFNLHYSIPNNGNKIRWTARLIIDDVSKAKHFDKKFEPYDRSKYCDNRSNEDRLKEMFGEYRKQ